MAASREEFKAQARVSMEEYFKYALPRSPVVSTLHTSNIVGSCLYALLLHCASVPLSKVVLIVEICKSIAWGWHGHFVFFSWLRS